MANKLCLFGGSFNPPHRTHERIIRAALQQLPLRELIVLPSGCHPHKDDRTMAPAATRLELCQLAFSHIEGVTVDDREIQREGPSYTIDTLDEFIRAEPGTRPFYLIGSDNLPLLPTWRRHHDLLKKARLTIFPRDSFPIEAATLEGLDLHPSEREELLSNILRVAPDNISATAIRSCLRDGDSLDQWLHPPVIEPIRELGLYLS